MTPEEEVKFRALRHKFYRLGKQGISILEQMGCLTAIQEQTSLTKETQRVMLFEIADGGRLDELESLIDKKEAEILERIGHKGDPCEFCNLSRDEVKPGPCPVRKALTSIPDPDGE